MYVCMYVYACRLEIMYPDPPPTYYDSSFNDGVTTYTYIHIHTHTYTLTYIHLMTLSVLIHTQQYIHTYRKRPNLEVMVSSMNKTN